MENIRMVDLKAQYQEIKAEIDNKVIDIIESSQYINGPELMSFETNLAKYLGVSHVIGCANGTDALQVALMALDLNPGDEVIVPAFTYVATAEVIALLKLKPIMVDVLYDSFEIQLEGLSEKLTEKTKAIIPVHLFGQCSNMDAIMDFAARYNITIIEDNAQSIGSHYNGKNHFGKAGTIGDIGTTSFFPSKNLGCYGDGGAIFTNNDQLATQIRMICNHGQSKTYHHDIVGCNSRLDALQAGILNIKLKHLDDYNSHRKKAAQYYNTLLSGCKNLSIPFEASYSNHVYHQYTLKIKNGKRNELRDFLAQHNIPTGIYYPIPLYKQKAFSHFSEDGFELENTEKLCQEVLSIPIHSHITQDIQNYISNHIIEFLGN